MPSAFTKSMLTAPTAARSAVRRILVPSGDRTAPLMLGAYGPENTVKDVAWEPSESMRPMLWD